MALILPELEQDALYRVSVEACILDADPLNNPPHVGLATVVRPYVCPDNTRMLSPLTDGLGLRAAFTSYIGISDAFPPGSLQALPGVFSGEAGCRITDITDGASQTIMVGERPPPDSLQAGWWYPAGWVYRPGFRGPNNVILFGDVSNPFNGDDGCFVRVALGPGRPDNPCDRWHLWSFHPGGANFLFADGAARFLPYSAEPLMIPLATRNGEEVIDLP
jgi:prepilin-type processing-associated H-X9-DG protein